MSLVQIMAIKAHTKKVFATLGKKINLKFNLKERKKLLTCRCGLNVTFSNIVSGSESPQ